MVIKPWGLEVVVWGAISAVGNIRDEIVVFAVIAPTPPPAIRCEYDGMKSVPGYCTWPAIPRMVGVLVIGVACCQNPIQLLLASATSSAIPPRAAPPVPIRCGPFETPLGGAIPIAFDHGSVFRIG